MELLPQPRKRFVTSLHLIHPVTLSFQHLSKELTTRRVIVCNQNARHYSLTSAEAG